VKSIFEKMLDKELADLDKLIEKKNKEFIRLTDDLFKIKGRIGLTNGN